MRWQVEEPIGLDGFDKRYDIMRLRIVVVGRHRAILSEDKVWKRYKEVLHIRGRATTCELTASIPTGPATTPSKKHAREPIDRSP